MADKKEKPQKKPPTLKKAGEGETANEQDQAGNNQGKSGKKPDPSVVSAEQQAAGATSPAPVQQAFARPLPDPELAASEFAQIVNLTKPVSATVQYAAIEGDCPEPQRWCLPDVNCTARVTMNQETIAAFKNNQEFCKSSKIVD